MSGVLVALLLLNGAWIGGLAAWVVYDARVGVPLRHDRDYWRRLADAQDVELRDKDAEIAKLEGNNITLTHNIEAVFGAGIMQGQLMQADREANGL